MNLIDEIDDYARNTITQQDPSQCLAHYWHRIKTALEAAQEMDNDLTARGHCDSCPPALSQAKFREVMGGKVT